MLAEGTVCNGSLYSEGDVREVLSAAHEKSIKKLEQFYEKIKNLTEENGLLREKDIPTLKKAKQNVWSLIEEMKRYDGQTYLLSLGGYKGLLLSEILEDEETESAIYLDRESQLPYGLVKLQLTGEM